MARVAYISSTFPDYKRCGVGIYAGYLTKALAQQGHDVHVITSDIPEIKSTFENVTIHKALRSWTPLEVPRLTNLFKSIRPDLIHINHPTAIAGKKTKMLVNLLPQINKFSWNLPTITTIHEFNNVSLLGKIKVTPLIIGSDAVTVTNGRYAEEVRKFIPIINKDKIHVINIGCAFDENLPDSNREEQRKRWNFDIDDKIIGFVGFLTPPKGFHNLIEAVAPLIRDNPKIKVLALSSWNLSPPAYREKILKQIEAEGISPNIVFAGFLEDNDLWAAMTAIDVCVFPFDEPVEERSSAPLRQALYKGLPTIVSARNVTYSEFGLAHKKNIWFTALNDLNVLRNDILTLLRDPQIQKELSLGALNLRPQLSFTGIAQSMGQLYSKVLKEKTKKIRFSL